jgi:tRNA-binding protein
MDVFYNNKGLADVLIIPLKDGDRDRDHVSYENHGNITRITDGKGQILGYNIFHASTYADLQAAGKLQLTEGLLAELKKAFAENEISDSLDFDLSPKFVVGHVRSKSQHENADKLSVCQVDVGDGMLQIVCGAPNVDEDQKVVVAKIGATMQGGLKIKPTELRGVPSNGMICSQKELGLPDAPEEKGIYVLDDSYRAGEPFIF